ARVFMRLGVIGFGGPAAHIAMMRDGLVRRRRWVTDAEFLDLVGATNLIPGPNSTELAMHLGSRRAGGRGLLVAGACFIGPAVVIVSVLAWLYADHGTDPAAVDLRYGILPVIIAIVGNALVGLGRVSLTNPWHVVIAAASVGGYLAGVHELAVLLVAGTFAMLAHRRSSPGAARAHSVSMAMAVMAAATRITQWRLFLVFLEVGSVLYGSGYVLLAFVQRNLIDELGWITTQQLLDAIAVGQITPGPVFTTATFIGWQVHGPLGAAVATVGIFLPSFVFVALLGRLVPWMQARPAARAFLGGVTAASLGLMAGVLIDLTDAALVDGITVALAAGALLVLACTRTNSAWLVGAGVVVGIAHALAA
ncbi:MAG: chromate efflux transporter, partial [Actinobacteria bacterium]|nr:chromate efflux transporter [Actinomycetota bacterium]